uniref:Uncharacterized protein n=1 Tax=Heterorhabditis bacteriophora TaxID=37862 RepID=A0A1I7WZZ0_HETBA
MKSNLFPFIPERRRRGCYYTLCKRIRQARLVTLVLLLTYSSNNLYLLEYRSERSNHYFIL